MSGLKQPLPSLPLPLPSASRPALGPGRKPGPGCRCPACGAQSAPHRCHRSDPCLAQPGLQPEHRPRRRPRRWQRCHRCQHRLRGRSLSRFGVPQQPPWRVPQPPPHPLRPPPPPRCRRLALPHLAAPQHRCLPVRCRTPRRHAVGGRHPASHARASRAERPRAAADRRPTPMPPLFRLFLANACGHTAHTHFIAACCLGLRLECRQLLLGDLRLLRHRLGRALGNPTNRGNHFMRRSQCMQLVS